MMRSGKRSTAAGKLAPVGAGAGAYDGSAVGRPVKKAAPRAREYRPRVAMSPSQVARAAQRYQDDGATVRELAKEFGVAYGTMHRRLAEAGVEMRRRGWRSNF